MDTEKTNISPFDTIPDMPYEEYRNQEVIETSDGAFFDALDEMFGIVPRTDQLIEDAGTSDRAN